MINEKGFYGLLSGILTTSILQPFQNIKVALILPPKNLTITHNFVANFMRASRYIYQADGYKGFYKGFSAANIKAGLGCYIYFTVLRWTGYEQDLRPYEDFLLSSSARIVSTFLTNPFNIIETRYEMPDFHQYKSLIGAATSIYEKQGPMGFFSGAIASCLKEGLFAGFYYMLYQQLKERKVNKMLAGILSGVISTTITHPIQIIRARIQTEGINEVHKASEHLIWRQMKNLHSEGGLFKGLAPRILKKPFANTLTFYMFQLIEDYKGMEKSKN